MHTTIATQKTLLSVNPDAAFINERREEVEYYHFPKAELDALLGDTNLTLSHKALVVHLMCLTHQTKNQSIQLHLKGVASSLGVSRDTVQRHYPKLVKTGHLAYETREIDHCTELQYRLAPAVRAALTEAHTRSTRLGKTKKKEVAPSVITPHSVHTTAPLPPSEPQEVLVRESYTSVPLTTTAAPTAPLVPTAPIALDLTVAPETIPVMLEHLDIPYYLKEMRLSQVVTATQYNGMCEHMSMGELLARSLALKYRFKAARAANPMATSSEVGIIATQGLSERDIELGHLSSAWCDRFKSKFDDDVKLQEQKKAAEERRLAHQKNLAEKALQQAAATPAKPDKEGRTPLPFGEALIHFVHDHVTTLAEKKAIHTDILEQKTVETLAQEALHYLCKEHSDSREQRWEKFMYLCAHGQWGNRSKNVRTEYSSEFTSTAA